MPSAQFHAFFWCLPTALLSWLLVGASLRYARWRGLIDTPGQRRSHQVATPRGGGLGLLLAALPMLALAARSVNGLPVAAAWLLLAALLALLLVGWLDDHRDLPGLPRLAVHLLAACMLAWTVLHPLPDWPPALAWLAGLGLVLAATWSINAHNFMDGIDALLGMQVLFYFAALGGIAWTLGAEGVALGCAALASASLGFLAWNRPPARVFMGDVGSVALGWLVVAMAALLWRQHAAALWPALILASAFLIDASLTLVRRMWLGRRWYTAHREHAYQWLVRSGLGHGQVVLLYLAWNLLLALPLAIVALRGPWLGAAMFALACVLGTTAHALIRRHCQSGRHRRKRGAA